MKLEAQCAISLDPSHTFRMFVELGYIPNLVNPKRKYVPRDTLVCYLFVVDDHHYEVMEPTTGRLNRCHISNFGTS